ncbi:MAG: hypothetical protein KF780_04665 [Sphingomonas sp.]|nr:hypothetical protein [Sphingomonas sp.]
MHKPLAACIAALLAVSPAAAHPADDEDSARLLPSSRDVAAMAPAIDRMVGVLLDVDVGPIVDAADPYARHPGYGLPGRSLGALGRSRDPDFDRRWRGALYGGTARLGAMMDSLAAAAPALRRSLREAENGIAAAIGEYRARRGDPRGPYYEDDDDPFED